MAWIENEKGERERVLPNGGTVTVKMKGKEIKVTSTLSPEKEESFLKGMFQAMGDALTTKFNQ